jgi:SHS2 domain-containing protein
MREDQHIPYTSVPHTADLALRIRGKDLPELFVNAAGALFDVMAVPPKEITARRSIEVSASDAEALLIGWLNELILLHETEGETYANFTLDAFSPTRLQATVVGGPTVEKTLVVKAATYHDLRIVTTVDGLEATIVFDI